MPDDGRGAPAPPGGSTPPDPDRIATPQDFGTELSRARERAGHTVRSLAHAASVRRSTAQDYLTGEHLPQPGNLDPLKRILAACGEGAAERVERWLSALARARRAPGRRTTAGAQPYRGLTGFEQEDAAWFHGRAELTSRIVEHVQELGRGGDGGRTLIVVGASGAGKSSLLRAGVIPAIRDRGYTPLLLTPGAQPAQALAAALGAADGGEAGVVLVVDQFEEIFTHEIPDDERQQVVSALCDERAPGDAAAPRVVLGMRADFYVPALQHPALAAVLQHHQILVTPMSPDELRLVIVEPARQANLTVEDGLVELVLSELTPRAGGTARETGTLPLLSHAMLATWSRHRGSRLTVADYLATGGIAGSISQSADAVFDGLSAAQQETARRLFVRLVHIGEDAGAGDTRRRVPLTEILGGRTDEENDDVQEVLDRFIAARLLTVGEDSVEISHEALVTAWPQLLRWIDADRDWLRRHHALRADAEEWSQSGRDPELLARGVKLAVLREWIEEGGRRDDLNALESAFFDESAGRAHDQQARERRRTRRRYQFVAALTALVVVAGTGITYGLRQAANRSREQAQDLSRQVASDSTGVRDLDVPLSMQLAVAGFHISTTPEATASLLNATGIAAATQVDTGLNHSEAIAAFGETIAVGEATGAVALMTAAKNGPAVTPGAVLHASAKPIHTVAFSADGRLLVAAGADGGIHLWDTSSLADPRPLPVPATVDSNVSAVAVSPDGHLIAANSLDGKLWLLSGSESTGYRLAAQIATGLEQVNGVTFTPDSRTLIAGTAQSTVHLWNVAAPFAPSPLTTLDVTGGQVFSVAVSPDGRTLAAGTSEGHDAVLWDLRDVARPVLEGTLTGPLNWVNTVQFSADGRTLAAAGSDGKLWLFDLSTRQAVARLAHPRPVTGVAFLADGAPVTVTVDDGVTRVWRLPGPVIGTMKDAVFAAPFDAKGDRLAVSPGANDDTLTVWNSSDIHQPKELGTPIRGGTGRGKFSGSAALTPDGRVLIAGDLNGTIELWDVSDPQHFTELNGGRPLAAAGALVEAVDLDQRGDLLAVAADDGRVHLYNLSDERDPTSDSVVRTPEGQQIYQVAFSPDGRLMVADSEDGQAYLYDVGNPDRPILLDTLGGFTSATYSAAFNGSGRLLAVGSADGTVRIWDVTDPHNPKQLGNAFGGPVGYIYSLAFSPDRDVLAGSGNVDGGVWLWDLSDPARPVHLATLAGPSTGVFWVAFGQHGSVLDAGGVNGTVQLWDVDPAVAEQWICSVVGQPITQQQWGLYIPGRAYSPPCR
jgi:WD40 repeat protein/transcriptional regulator with XRE-family HTH domain